MQRTIFMLGIITLALLWVGPLPDLARSSFAAHMALHMGIVAVVAPLISLGIAATKFDPVRRAPNWFPPIPLSILELIAVWVWHAPVLHHSARYTTVGFVAEQATFLGAGLLVWLSALGGDRTRRDERTGAGVAALLLTSMHMTLLGALVALTPRALYVHAAHGAGNALNALDDQHLGGAIMIVVGGVAYLAGGLGLTARLVRRKLVKEARA